MGGVGLLWTFFIAFPFLAFMTSSCDAHGAAKLSPWLLPIYFLFFARCLWYEFRSLRLAVILPAANCAPFRFLGVPLRFRQWLAVAVALSALGHTDVSSSGMFVAKAVATESCG